MTTEVAEQGNALDSGKIKRNQQIGERLRRIRNEKNISQIELGKLFKLKQGQGTISAYENGKLPLGKHGLQMYVAILGASSKYILTGEGPMFAAPKKGELTLDVLIDTLQPRPGGNLRFIGPRDIGRFLETGYAHTMAYHLLPGDCYSFPVMTYDLGADYPYGSQLICTRIPAVGLQVGRVYAFQTDIALVMGRYAGRVEGQYVVSVPHGPDTTLNPDEVRHVYYAERIDKPVI